MIEELDIPRIRADFPILGELMHEKPLVYLDNAATTQKPKMVLDAIYNQYAYRNANIHRGVYPLSEETTKRYDDARTTVAKHLGAKDSANVVFVRGATEGVNLIASAWGRTHLSPGDEIILTLMEHHANIVPWQMVALEKGATIRVVPVTGEGELDLEAFEKLLTPKTKVVGVVYASNALGTINPVKQMIERAHAVGAIAVIDATQALPHFAVDVEALGCDFFVCSGHKCFGPTGIGALYGKAKHWDTMPPYQTGGDMILRVSFEKTSFKGMPERYEAGTPHIVGAIGFAEAIRYVNALGLESLERYEATLLTYATQSLQDIKGIRILGTAKHKVPLISFLVEGVHPHDVATMLAMEGVAIRAGHHCTQPLMQHYAIAGTNRISLAFYNNREDIDKSVRAIQKTIQFFK